MEHKLTLFILAIEGIIPAMLTLSDFTGEAFAMHVFERPRVSYIDIIKRTEEHAIKRRLDHEGMKLMEFRIQTIISTLGLLGEDFQQILTPDWWRLDRECLTAQPKEMLFKVYFEKEGRSYSEINTSLKTERPHSSRSKRTRQSTARTTHVGTTPW